MLDAQGCAHGGPGSLPDGGIWPMRIAQVLEGSSLPGSLPGLILLCIRVLSCPGYLSRRASGS